MDSTGFSVQLQRRDTRGCHGEEAEADEKFLRKMDISMTLDPGLPCQECTREWNSQSGSPPLLKTTEGVHLIKATN